MLILVNFGYNQTVGFRERHGQSLVKVGQIQSNLIDVPKTTRLGWNLYSNLGYWDWRVWCHIGVDEIWDQLVGQIERT